MKRATVYIVVLGILCTGLGVAIGVAIDKRNTARNLPRIVRGHLLKHPRAARFLESKVITARKQRQKVGAAKLFQRINRELGLTPEQSEEVKAILEGTKQEIKQSGEEFRTYVKQAREKSHAQILEVLDPEQKEKFENLTTAIEERKERKGLRGKEWK